MSSAKQLSEVCKTYNTAVWDLHAKIQQGRRVHSHELANAYMEGVLCGVPDHYLSMMEATISDRNTYNGRKVLLQAVQWDAHDKDMAATVGKRGTSVFSKGASGLTGGGHDPHQRSLLTAARAYNAQMWALNKKLHQDRSVHAKELDNLLAQALKTHGTPAEYTGMLQAMVDGRKKFNQRKTELDAKQWGALEKSVDQKVGPALAHKVLTHGADPRLMGDLGGGCCGLPNDE